MPQANEPADPVAATVGAAVTFMRAAGVSDEQIAHGFAAAILTLARQHDNAAWSRLFGELAAVTAAATTGEGAN
jgi:hypothetical protein